MRDELIVILLLGATGALIGFGITGTLQRLCIGAGIGLAIIPALLLLLCIT